MAEDALRDRRCGTDESKRTASLTRTADRRYGRKIRHLRTKAHAARKRPPSSRAAQRRRPRRFRCFADTARW